MQKNDPSFCPRSSRTKSSFPRTCKHALHTSVKCVHVCSFDKRFYFKRYMCEKDRGVHFCQAKHKCFITAGEEKNRAATTFQNKNITGWKRLLLLFYEPRGWFCQLFMCFSKLNFLIAALFLDYCEGFSHTAHICEFSGSKLLIQINCTLTHSRYNLPCTIRTSLNLVPAQFHVIKAFLMVLNIFVKLSVSSNYHSLCFQGKAHAHQTLANPMHPESICCN